MKHNFKNLNAWRKSMILVKDIYEVTQEFPSEERYGLTSQIRRSVVSMPSNIAEGCGRNTNKELSRFLDISNGSSCELETQILLSMMLGYIPKDKMEELTERIAEIRRMNIGFQKTLKF